MIGPQELERGEISPPWRSGSRAGLPQFRPAGLRLPMASATASRFCRSQIRLRADVTINEKKLQPEGPAPPSRRDPTALRTYGAIVVDRAAVPSLYAPLGTSNKILRGDELGLAQPQSDFE